MSVIGAITMSNAVRASDIEPALEIPAYVLDDFTAVKEIYPEASFTWDPNRGLVAFMSIGEVPANHALEAGTSAALSYEPLYDFLNASSQLLRIENPDDHLRVVDAVRDHALPGVWSVRLQQYHDGLLVHGSQAVADVSAEGEVLSFSNNLVGPLDIPAAPELTRGMAISTALNALASRLDSLGLIGDPINPLADGRRDTDISIVLLAYPSGDGARLSWRVRVELFEIFVDALNGEILHLYHDMHYAGIARKTYDLGLSGGKFPGKIMVLDERGPAGGLTPHPEARQAHDNVKIAYDYFRGAFGLRGYDRRDSDIVSHVRLANYDNAGWNSRDKWLQYGSGWAEPVDIVGHEYTHAVIQHRVTGGLSYYNESGAINEAICDLFGVMVEAAAGDFNWTIGEKAPGRQAPAKPIRDLMDPINGGFDKTKVSNRRTNAGQPDDYSQIVRPGDAICSGVGSLNGCVHYNSGIINKAFYLMSDGGTQNGISVVGIGREKTANIIYGTLSSLNSDASMMTFAQQCVRKCINYIGFSGITKKDCCQGVEQAFRAVDIRFLVRPDPCATP